MRRTLEGEEEVLLLLFMMVLGFESWGGGREALYKVGRTMAVEVRDENKERLMTKMARLILLSRCLSVCR